jgi:MFS family permease
MKFRIPIYILAIIGDLNYSLLLVLSVIYASLLGASPTEIGLIGGAYGITYLFMPMILGRLSDRFPRKYGLLIAISLQLLSTLFVVFVNSIMGLILCQIFMGVAYGFYWPNIEAILSESSLSEREHHHSISNFCLSWSIGFTFGPLLAGIFSDTNVILGFLLSFILYCVSLIIVIFLVKKTPPFKNTSESIQSFNISQEGSNMMEISQMILLMSIFVYSILVKIILSYFPSYAVLPNGLRFSGSVTGTILFLFGLGRTIFFIVGRFMHAHIEAIRNNFVIFGIFFLLIPLMKNELVMSIVFAIFGFFIGRQYLFSLNLLLEQEKEKKGAKAGIFESFIGFGTIFSPIIAGYIAQFDKILPFYIFSAVAFIVFGIVFLLLKKIQTK